MDNHMRIHYDSKPYLCPYLTWNEDSGCWTPCMYAAARQDDLTKHTTTTSVCHLQKFSKQDEMNNLIPLKEIVSKKETKKYKLREGNAKLDQKSFQEYVSRSPDFMYELEKKIMKKWTAIYNAASKKKDYEIIQMVKEMRIPTLKQKVTYPANRDRLFTNPVFEFCDMTIKIDELKNLCKLFGNYVVGKAVKETHQLPNIPKLEGSDLEEWKRRADFRIKNPSHNY